LDVDVITREPAHEPALHTSRLFLASCVALGSSAVLFTIKADILGDLRRAFALTSTQLGWMLALAAWGFTVTILVGGTLCDLIGMKATLAFAFAFQIGGTLLTIYAPDRTVFALATLVTGLGSGLMEAAVSPLVATLYPGQKTQKLSVLHASWPAGMVLGSAASYAFTRMGLGWQAKLWLVMAPTLAYGLLFLPLSVPATERVQSGVSAAAMYREAFRPFFAVLLIAMLVSAALESGADQWIGEIMKKSGLPSGILVLGWIGVGMFFGRLFAGPLVRALAPTGVLMLSSVAGIAGLLWLSAVHTPAPAYAASLLLALGTCYAWPTLLGITSERFPKGGAFLLSLMGGAGMIAGGFAQPAMGKLYQTYGPEGALRCAVVLPAALVIIFALVWLSDRTRGGYAVETLRERGRGSAG